MVINTFNSEGPTTDELDAKRARDCGTTLIWLAALGVAFVVYAGSLNDKNPNPTLNSSDSSSPEKSGYAVGTKNCEGLPGYSYLTYAGNRVVVQIPGENGQRDITGLPSNTISVIASSGAECIPLEYHDPNTGSTIVWYYIQTSSLPPGY